MATINIYVTRDDDPVTHTLLHQILTKIETLDQKENLIMADLTALTDAVAASTTVEQSAATLLAGLSAAITAAGTDPAALAAVVDSIDSNTAALSAAVVANTPAA